MRGWGVRGWGKLCGTLLRIRFHGRTHGQGTGTHRGQGKKGGIGWMIGLVNTNTSFNESCAQY